MGNIGIYIFKNTKEKKCYIGQSSNLKRRKREHYGRTGYKDEFHINLRENPDDFEYKVLQECLVKELDDLELMWINWYKNEGWELYNICLRKMPNTRSKTCSEEHKRKISESRKGKYTGEDNSFYGKHHSLETKELLRELRKGKYTGEDHPMFGKHHSEESRKKMSESRKGKYTGEANPNYGKIGWCKGKHWKINPETGTRIYY